MKVRLRRRSPSSSPRATLQQKNQKMYTPLTNVSFLVLYMFLHVIVFFCVKIPNFVLVLSPIEFDALKDVGMKMAALTPEDLQKMRAELWYGEHHAVDDKGFLMITRIPIKSFERILL